MNEGNTGFYIVGCGDEYSWICASTPPRSFELDKFLATIIISLLMGVLPSGFGWNYTVAGQWLANGAITLYIYWIAKIVAIRVGWIKLPETAAKT